MALGGKLKPKNKYLAEKKKTQIEFFGIAKPHSKEVQDTREWNCRRLR
jgi:hypothetical protein